MIRRPPRSTLSSSSAASDVYKRQAQHCGGGSMSEARKAVCIMAWPAAHSRSPLIHNYWIKQHNLNAEYRREAVPPEKFAEFVTHLHEHGYVGGNVTVPHKQAVLALSEPDERARGRRSQH